VCVLDYGGGNRLLVNHETPLKEYNEKEKGVMKKKN
jgi:hypothetical protein